MLNEEKLRIIAQAKQVIGWPYKKIKKLSEKEIEKANLKRKQYFKFFNENNIKYASDNLSKPYLNNLSPGCLSCVKGVWSCLYIIKRFVRLVCRRSQLFHLAGYTEDYSLKYIGYSIGTSF